MSKVDVVILIHFFKLIKYENKVHFFVALEYIAVAKCNHIISVLTGLLNR